MTADPFDTSHIVAKRKEAMCGKKNSFRTRAAADRQAEKFGQRVYECPVCFCFHCTSRASWRDDFLTVEEAEKAVEDGRAAERTALKEDRKADKAERASLHNQNQQLRGNYKAERAEMAAQIAELLKENAALKRRLLELEASPAA